MKKSCSLSRTSLAVVGLALLQAVSAEAATLTVTSAADAGGACPGASCTLRQAIAAAAAGDTINFSLPASSTISLTSAELLLNKNLTITGPGANRLSVQRSAAAGNFRVLNITPASVSATISGLTIANGNVSGSGGGLSSLGTLTLSNVTISDNRATNGGGIFNNFGTLTITSSTISSNTVSNNIVAGSGGGIFNSGGTMALTNSTVSGNTAIGPGGNSDSGGGIITNVGTVTLTNCTISGNSGDLGGGIRNVNGGTVRSRNTIIALNTSASGPDFNGPLTSQGYNLIGDIMGVTVTPMTGDQFGVTAAQLNLDPLRDNGGPTRTHALLIGSTAIEKGHSSGSITDQRGFARPVDSLTIGNAMGGDGSDIGAYEVQADQLPGCSDINRVVNNNNDGGTDSLRTVISSVCAGSTITFAPNVRGAIILTSGELYVNKPLIINGPGADQLVIQRDASAGNFRILNFDILSGNKSISGLRISNGNPAGSGFDGVGGGILSRSGSLTIASCTISGNSASVGPDGGGAGILSLGILTIGNSTISGNTTGFAGGGIAMQGGTATITNSTISGNSAGNGGGGIFNFDNHWTLTNSTITANFGGGVYNLNNPPTVRNTIIALNPTASGQSDFNGALTSAGFNLIGNNFGATITPTTGDQIGTPGAPIDPLLGPLQNNGGPTFTHALLAGSTAIDRGHSSGSTADQRGFTRPVGNASVSGGDGGDIGAFEVQAPGSGPTFGNISTRLRVETGDNVLIGGFIVTGTQAKRVIVRAIGPSLPLIGTLTNPTLELRNSGGLIASNDNWRSTQEAEIIATGIPPSDNLESAIVSTLPANNSAYTAIVRGVNNTTGIGLVEAYDLDRTVDSKLANISTRGLVQTGDNVLIGGLIVLGQDPLRVILRAIGPSLPVPGALGNPTLELRDGNGVLIVANDNWRSDQEAEIIATGIPPSNDLESAIVRDLAPGNYTAIVRGVNNTTGVALVEAYGLN